MATKLEPGKTIKRQIHIFGVDAPVNVEITSDGLAFSVAGAKKKTTLSWFKAVDVAITPDDCPAHLYGKPYQFLQSQANKKAKNTEGLLK